MYSNFVEQAISDLLATGSVVECDSAPIVVITPYQFLYSLTVKKKGLFCICGIRIILYFVMKSKVKFENAKTILFSFVDSSQNWLFSCH